MVHSATPRVLGALRLAHDECKIVHELAVGHSIADIAILRRAESAGSYWPEGPLSVVESSILYSLRRLGTANVDAIAKEVFMQVEPVRKLLLGRLSNWSLVQNCNGDFRTPRSWISQSEIIAIEAKLTRWRDAICQAVAYRRYANRAYVLLPERNAAIASQHKLEFTEAGVGLLSYCDGNVTLIIKAPKSKEHAWHREFAMSRIR